FAEKEKSPEQIRAIIETFVDRIVVSKDDYVIKLRLSFEWWRRPVPDLALILCAAKLLSLGTL
ncbi:hypothetical protein, partial [Anaeromusa sp.]|uniref:hypothetical protein n=1 Tax=Anaeromusa sp. TaxID=1872520 RepID=UPI002606AF91